VAEIPAAGAATGTAGTPVIMARRPGDWLITAWVNGHTGTIQEHVQDRSLRDADGRIPRHLEE
jgi:hypothetical protein